MTQIKLSEASFSFLTQGAIIQEFAVAGTNLVLSYASAESYLEAPYFGETIGRVANRIEGGLIRDLNGQSYHLAVNQAGKHHLHGGNVGWGHRQFSPPLRVSRNGKEAVQLTYRSPDGEEGYPGTVELRLWYTPYEDGGNAILEIEYEVEFLGNECNETVVNVTNHSYFNLSDAPTIEGTEIILATSDVLETDEDAIPTGVITDFAGMHANHKVILGVAEPVVDHCFVMDRDFRDVPLDTRVRQLRRLARAYHSSSGISLEIHSTEPSFQFYTGDYVNVPATGNQPARRSRAGFCIEPGRFINAVNRPEWRNQVVLSQGQVWGSKTVYKAWKA